MRISEKPVQEKLNQEAHSPSPMRQLPLGRPETVIGIGPRLCGLRRVHLLGNRVNKLLG